MTSAKDMALDASPAPHPTPQRGILPGSSPSSSAAMLKPPPPLY